MVGCQNGITISRSDYINWCKGFYKTHKQAEIALQEESDVKLIEDEFIHAGNQ